MATYAIDDGHGNQLSAGLSEYDARKTAQRMADSRGESVYLYEVRIDRDDDGADSEPESEEFAPTLSALYEQERGDAAQERGGSIESVVNQVRDEVADARIESADRARITGLDDPCDELLADVRRVLPAGWTADWSDDDVLIEREPVTGES